MAALAASSSATVSFFDPHDLFCYDTPEGGRRCGAAIPGTATVGYFDDNHLSTAGSLYLWPHLCSHLAAHIFLPEPPAAPTPPAPLRA